LMCSGFESLMIEGKHVGRATVCEVGVVLVALFYTVAERVPRVKVLHHECLSARGG